MLKLKFNSWLDVLKHLFIAVGVGKTFYVYVIRTGMIDNIDWHGIVSLFISGILFAIVFFCLNLVIGSHEQKEWLNIYLKHLLLLRRS